jgi:hypothetical protein
MKRHVHYEAAFEDYLRASGVPYVAVDEARKAVFVGTDVKSFDFLVYAPGDRKLIVDVKGRKFGGASSTWQCWVNAADVEGLAEWERVFGEGYQSVFAFAYWLAEPTPTPLFDTLHEHGGRRYAFLAVPLADYRAGMKPRSKRWDTVSLPSQYFRQVFVPMARLLGTS